MRCGVTFDELYALGERADEPDGKFNMAVMGMRLASRRNGVAALHGAVAREMFSGMWPALPVQETPIGHITNGVHARTWVSDRIDELLSDVVGDDWHLASAEAFERVRHVDHHEIWEVRRQGRKELVELVRDRLGSDLLDPDVLTIGFARRFATYKRANLLLGQLDRLKQLVLDADRPVQFVFAGKAHPADQPGKSTDAADQPDHARRRRPPPVRVHPRLRHRHRADDVPRLRRLAEHAAAPDRGVRHERR